MPVQRSETPLLETPLAKIAVAVLGMTSAAVMSA